jgi:D-cysteine desulfhydrase family pyridoxal phosphate-dependent enzyme
MVKRDDETGLAFGGNKTRKLELLLAEAQANGAKTLITTGAIQSNHCRQTAAVAARFGMDCILVLVGEEPAIATGNYLLDRLLGAEFVWASQEQRDSRLQTTFEQAWTDGRRPYLIPYGGSNRVGAVAYTYALQELLQQGINPDWIVFPSSSGGTQAGLVLGANLYDYKGKILGISVDEPEGVLCTRVANLANEAADLLGEATSISPDEILVNADYTGAGYGVMGALERKAIHLFAKNEGLLLDPVYTGRAAGGLIELAQKGYFPSGQSVLFWHTGGTPALFVDRYVDLVK